MPEAKDDLKREKVRVVPISNIEDFPDHPFQVKDDESMAQLVESIRMNGVLNPVIALKIDENHYQLISGHRRKRACILLGIDRIPLIGRELSKEEAIIEMVDSNLQREHILPSEKAKAYKMKMEAMKNQGKRTDLTSTPMATNYLYLVYQLFFSKLHTSFYKPSPFRMEEYALFEDWSQPFRLRLLP